MRYKRIFLFIIEVFGNVEESVEKHVSHFTLLQITQAGFARLAWIHYIKNLESKNVNKQSEK